MKKTLFLIVGIFMMFNTDKALADCSGYGCYTVKFEMLYVDTVRTFIKTSGVESQLTQCTAYGSSQTSVWLENSHPNADKIYALLLTAYTAKLNVRLVFNQTGNTADICTINYAVLENN